MADGYSARVGGDDEAGVLVWEAGMVLCPLRGLDVHAHAVASVFSFFSSFCCVYCSIVLAPQRLAPSRLCFPLNYPGWGAYDFAA